MQYNKELEKIFEDFQKNKEAESINNLDKILVPKIENSETFRKDCIMIINFERYHECLEYIEKMIVTSQNNDKIISRKAFVLEMLGKFEKALEQYDLSLKINPNNDYALKNKCMLLINLEEYERALELIEKNLENNPKDIDIVFAKALTLELLGQNEEAITHYLDSLQIDRNDVESIYDFGFHFINRLKMENPMDFYKKISKVSPNEKFNTIFKQLIEDEKFIEELYDKYLARNPDLYEVRHWQKILLEKQNRKYVEEEIRSSIEAKDNITNLEMEPKIIEIFRKFLDRKNPSRQEINYFKNKILEGKDFEWVENEIKNSKEAKQLPYWKNTDQ